MAGHVPVAAVVCGRVAHILISGWLAFTFFRDTFPVTLVKSILEFSLLLPAALISIARFVAYAAGNRQHLPGGRPNDAHVITS
jgi:ABC-type sulfate transport system permease component